MVRVRAEELEELFEHTRPDGSSCFTALDQAGINYRAAGENIAMGYRSPEAVVEGWMNSPGHRANILNGDFTHIGVGYAPDWNWAQLFVGTSRPVELPEEPEQPDDTQEPQEPDEPGNQPGQSQNLLPNGQEITDDNIRGIIYGLKGQYPEGMPWTNDDEYFSAPLHTTGYGCAGFALICSDAVFDDLPITEEHSDFSRIRVGDMLRINNDTHSVVVLEVRENSVIVTEGNYNSSIHWGREISRDSLESRNFWAITRYPA